MAKTESFTSRVNEDLLPYDVIGLSTVLKG